MAVLSFLTLEDFVSEAKDVTVRVEGISRVVPSTQPGGDVKEWYVLVTAKVDDDIVMFSARIGRCLALFERDEPHHAANTEEAERLVREYLELSQGLEVRRGTWEPHAVMENLSGGDAGLWHFEDRTLVPE